MAEHVLEEVRRSEEMARQQTMRIANLEKELHVAQQEAMNADDTAAEIEAIADRLSVQVPSPQGRGDDDESSDAAPFAVEGALQLLRSLEQQMRSRVDDAASLGGERASLSDATEPIDHERPPPASTASGVVLDSALRRYISQIVVCCRERAAAWVAADAAPRVGPAASSNSGHPSGSAQKRPKMTRFSASGHH